MFNLHKRSKSIQFTLFSTYALILLISFIIFSIFFIIWEVNKTEKETFIDLQQTTHSLASSIDNNLEAMDMISMNVSYSNLIKDEFATYNSYSSNLISYTDKSTTYTENIKALGNLLTAIMGPNRPVNQINLYTLNGDVFSSGLDNSSRKEDITQKEWYPQVLTEKGNKVITLSPNDSRLSKYFSSPDSQNFVSLCRLYFNTLNIPVGIIEVKKNYKDVFASLLSGKTSLEEQVYVFNEAGDLIFPVNKGSELATFYYSQIEDFSLQNATLNLNNPKDRGKVFVKYAHSDYSHFTTLVVVEKSKLFAPIYSYLKLICIITLLFLLCTLVLSFISTKRITTPIHKLFHEMQSLNLASLDSPVIPPIATSVTELKVLYEGFQKMQIELKKSIEQQMLLQNQEMQSKMLALQSQMNPHFLYNSIATLQAMASENMNKEIIVMCQTMARLLRYISSNTDQLVPLKLELDHTIDYLTCMGIRYDGDLFYDISIPDALMEQMVPKLCLQLIVENAIKFTSQTRPPWHLQINGTLTEREWTLSVIDNGPGFSEAQLKDIENKINQINTTHLLPSLELNGMGLMNIYIRLMLLYHQDIIFRLSNVEPHGAHIMIGGEL